MTRRKGEQTARKNERDFPFMVELMVPERGLKSHDAIIAWHRELGIRDHRGRSRYADRIGTSAGALPMRRSRTPLPRRSAA